MSFDHTSAAASVGSAAPANYMRLLDSDLALEASLLRCYATLHASLRSLNIPGVRLESIGDGYDVRLDLELDGLTVPSLLVMVGDKGYRAYRPARSDDPWRLVLASDAGAVELFSPRGWVTPAAIAFFRRTSEGAGGNQRAPAPAPAGRPAVDFEDTVPSETIDGEPERER